MSDQDLIQKLKTKDVSSFKELFEKYHSMVFNTSCKMLGNREDAEDLTQDVFIKAYKSIHSFRGEAKLSTWLYKITINQCLKQRRRKKIVRWLSLDFLLEESGGISSPSSLGNPDSEIMRKESEKIIQSAVDSLPEKQKAAFILHRYEELSYKEVAEVMNISVSAVESSLHRAKENLSIKLFNYIKKI